MRILLVHPPFIYTESESAELRDSMVPVLGANSLAGFLRGQGHEVLVIDPLYYYLTRSGPAESFEQTVLRIAGDFSPTLIGMSLLSHLRWQAYKLLTLLRQFLPDCLLIVGGVHVTDGPEIAVTQFRSVADVIVAGGGHLPLEAIASANGDHQRCAAIPGVIWAREGCGVAISPGSSAADIAPAPSSLPDYDQYSSLAGGLQRVFFVTSQGCPYSCRFCSTAIRRGLHWTLSPETVIEQIQHLQGRYGTDEVCFQDETFFSYKERAKKIFDLMAEKRLALKRLYVHTTIASLEKDILVAYRRAGGRQLFVGLESGSMRIRNEMNKPLTQRLTNDEIVERTRLCRELGVGVGLFIIAGWPGETAEDRMATEAIVERIQPGDLHVSVLKLYPGTEIYKRALQERRIEETCWLGPEPYFTYQDAEDLTLTRSFARKLEAAYRTDEIRKPYEGQGDRYARAQMSDSAIVQVSEFRGRQWEGRDVLVDAG
jgi:anaerobic magnesium-protoporphyrin IX monomethyl ester cyclase